MSQPLRVVRITPAAYYRRERESSYKSDFYEGEIFAMSGGTVAHSLIATNICGELRQRLRGCPCTAFESNLRLRVRATGLRTYPDVSVYCDPLERDEEDGQGETLTNPAVIFEILSKSTEGYDRGLKAASYRQIPSLRAYVLVWQEAPRVEMFERQLNGTWILSEFVGLDSTLPLRCLSIDLPLKEIFERVEFRAVAE